MRTSGIVRWLPPALLFALSCWTANLTLFNWWVAGGPPTPNPHRFEVRGNIFAVITLLLFASAVTISIMNFRRSRS
jgi:hypothetical protein